MRIRTPAGLRRTGDNLLQIKIKQPGTGLMYQQPVRRRGSAENIKAPDVVSNTDAVQTLRLLPASQVIW